MGSTTVMNFLHRPRRAIGVSCVLTLGLLAPTAASAATLAVGPDKTYKTVNAAVAAAKSGDTIEVDAGEYVDDISAIKVGNLTIRGVGGARAHLKAVAPPPNKKGIFVVEGGDAPVTFEHLELSGARISEGDGNNGAGIRAQGVDVVVRDCYIHDNQNGILTNASSVTVEYSELAYNGEAGYEHNIYVGEAPMFVFRGNYSHHAQHGYAVKSRAFENHIVYNRLMEEGDGNGSGLIDLPQGGLTYVIGNLIEKGPAADNKNRVVLYKGEGATNPDLRLFVSHNTFVNDGSPNAVFVDVKTATEVTLGNNLFVGKGTPFTLAGDIPIVDLGNLQGETPGLVDVVGFDYHLLVDSVAVDAGVALAPELTPDSQYVHPAQVEARPVVGAPDLGAYEFGEGMATTGDDTGSTSTSEGTDTDTGAESGNDTGANTATSATETASGGTAGDTGSSADPGETEDSGNSGATGTGAGEVGGDPPTSGDAPTSGDDGTASGATDSDTDGAGSNDDDSGCGCRNERGRGTGWTLLTAAFIWIGRRRGAGRRVSPR